MAVDGGHRVTRSGWPAPAGPGAGLRIEEHAGFRPLERLARVVVGALGLTLALNLALSLQTGRLLALVGSDPAVLDRLLSDGVSAVDVTYLVRTLAFVGGGVCFIRWFRRAYGNLPALGHPCRHGIGWSIGAWFVPILQFFRPRQIATELWAAVDPPGAASRPPVLVSLWWGLFLSSTWFETHAAGLAVRATTLPELRNSLFLETVSYLLSAAAATTAIAFVIHVSNGQDARAAAITRPSGQESPLWAVSRAG